VKITATPQAAAVRSRRDGVLWLWRVHNEVNARLAQVCLTGVAVVWRWQSSQAWWG
jgi:hypothetical protein